MLNEKDKALVQTLKLDGFDEEKQLEQLKFFYQTLYLRIGPAVEAKLTDYQLGELVKISKESDEKALDWLLYNVTELKDVIAEEERKLIKDILDSQNLYIDSIKDLK